MKRFRTFLLIIILSVTIGVGFYNVNSTLQRVIKQQRLQEIKIDLFLQNFSRLDLPNANKAEEANLVILNKTKSAHGSGTHIKYNGEHYVLSCDHLIGTKKDEFIAIDKTRMKYKLTLIRRHRGFDLSLFKIEKNNLNYLTIAETGPNLGSKIHIIGNPANLRGVVTEGVVSNIQGKFSVYSAIVYFGNSGGAVLYKGEVVGVATQIKYYKTPAGVSVSYSYGPNLKAIKVFLNE